MKVYLCDHIWNRFSNPKSAWHKFLACAFGPLFQQAASTNDNEAPAQHIAYSEADNILFAHSNYPATWTEMAQQPQCRSHIILVRRDGRQVAVSNDKSNLHGCFWSPEEFVDRPRPKLLIQQIVSGQEVDWRLLQPENSEALFAANLLIRAKDICGGNAPVVVHGRSIYAPPADAVSHAETVLNAASDQEVSNAATKMADALERSQEL